MMRNCHLTYKHYVAAIGSFANHKSSTSSGSFVSYKWRGTSVISTHVSHMGSCQLWWTLLKITSGLKEHVRRMWLEPLYRLHFVEDFMVDLVLSELDFNFFFGDPLPGTVMGSRTSLNSSQSTSGTYGNTGPYILPSFAPAVGTITTASCSRTRLVRSYASVERDAMKAAARLRLWSSWNLSRVGE